MDSRKNSSTMTEPEEGTRTIELQTNKRGIWQLEHRIGTIITTGTWRPSKTAKPSAGKGVQTKRPSRATKSTQTDDQFRKRLRTRGLLDDNNDTDPPQEHAPDSRTAKRSRIHELFGNESCSYEDLSQGHTLEFPAITDENIRDFIPGTTPISG